MLSATHDFVILTRIPEAAIYSHFSDEDLEAQTGLDTRTRSHSLRQARSNQASSASAQVFFPHSPSPPSTHPPPPASLTSAPPSL